MFSVPPLVLPLVAIKARTKWLYAQPNMMTVNSNFKATQPESAFNYTYDWLEKGHRTKFGQKSGHFVKLWARAILDITDMVLI